MRPYFATTVRAVVFAAALPACLAATLQGETAFAAASEDAATPAAGAEAGSAPADAAPPVAKSFNPAAMPEVGPAKSPLGYHYAELTPSQTTVLRRGFKLPLDALASANSSADLKRAVVVAPLPDPNRPLLAVSPAAESQANPFADSEAISFRKDPLKALGALLGASDAQPAGGATAAAAAEEDDPFGAGGDPFGGTAGEADEGAGEGAAAEEDPFGDF